MITPEMVDELERVLNTEYIPGLSQEGNAEWFYRHSGVGMVTLALIKSWRAQRKELERLREVVK